MTYRRSGEIDPVRMTRLLIGSRGGRRRRRLLQLPSTPRIATFALLISVGKAGDT